MVLNQMNRAVPYECGTVNKCVNCNMMYMCPRSPYCRMGNNNNMDMAQPDLTPLQNTISGLSGMVAQQSQEIDFLKSNVNEINEKINSLHMIMSNLSGSVLSGISALSSKMDGNQTKNEYKASEVPNGIVLNNSGVSQEVQMQGASMVPYSQSNANEDTVLVEKKGMFGKTKWVEEKRK